MRLELREMKKGISFTPTDPSELQRKIESIKDPGAGSSLVVRRDRNHNNIDIFLVA